MLLRATFLAALAYAASQPLAAEPLHADSGNPCTGEINGSTRSAACPTAVQGPQSPAHIIVIIPGRDGLGDIHGARGPGPHARELREVAIAAAFGDPEKVEITARQLRKFGVTREAIQEVIAQASLHTGALAGRAFQLNRQERLDHAESETDPAW